jgi:hypothetical protein
MFLRLDSLSSGPEIELSSIDWIQLSRILPEDGGTVQSPKRF